MTSRVLVVLGASGVGKTAAVRALEGRGNTRCFYFDSIGVPSTEEMVREFGSGEAWQAEETRRWLVRLAGEPESGPVVLEGQTRPSHVRAGLGDIRLDAAMLLLDCRPEVRAARLQDRGQPELATLQMDAWAVYLRGQADALGLAVLDTSDLSIDAVADAIAGELESMVTVV